MTASRGGVLRAMHVVAAIARHAAAHLSTVLAGRYPWAARWCPGMRVSGPVRLRMALEDLGGSFIKLGQMLALQPDILPLEYCNALFSLLDRVAPFPYEEVERTFLEEFGRKPGQLFDTFDTRPLAAASVGQVHVAMLSGRKLAVKVRRPTVEQDFAGDIRLIVGVMRLITRLRLTSLLWLLEPLGEFVSWTGEELDYRIEARYMERLRRNAAEREAEHIPQVLSEYTTRRTLVAEFLEGHTVLACLRARESPETPEAQQISDAGLEPRIVARNIIDNFLGAVFRHGMFHADLHPANLLVLPGNRIGYIDFGITGVISQYSRRNLVALTLAYTSGDMEGMAEAFFRVCRMTDEESPRKFRLGLKEVQRTWYDREGGGCRLRRNFTLVMLDMLRLSRRSGVWPDRDVIKYIRSAIAIDGLITRMSPSFDISQYLATVCASHLRWQVRQSFLTYDTLADMASAGGRIWRDGLARSSAAVARITDCGLSTRIELQQARPDPAQRWPSEVLSLGAIALAAAAIGRQSDPALGMNLFTAAAVVVALASMKLARTFRRMVGVAQLAGS